MEKYTFDEFEAASYGAWKQLAEKTLKGKPFESICTSTYENITLKPLYTKEDESARGRAGITSLLPAKRNTIAQEAAAKSPAEGNRALVAALAHGQQVLHLLLDKATLQGLDSDTALVDDVLQAGTPISSAADLEELLADIDMGKYPFLLYTGQTAAPMLALLAAYCEKAGIRVSALQGTIGADPIGYAAETGKTTMTPAQSLDAMSSTVQWAKKHTPALRTILVRTDQYHNAGANAVQELAAALATAAAYVREGVKRGLSAEDVCRQLTFSVSVGTQLFMEIAKLRAIRILWKRIAESFGANTNTIHLHARTSRRTKTMYDHHVNLLRATTEAFSAVVGGADTIHVSTYTEAYNILEENGERWARNIQHMLHGESHLSKVIDPASGSYYVEALTEELAKKTWELFQEIEAKGGMSSVLQQGWLQAEIAKTATRRYRSITALEQKIVGTNIYVKKDEVRLAAVHTQNEELVQRRVADLVKYKEQRLAGTNVLPKNERSLNELIRAGLLGATLGELTALFVDGGETIEPLPAMRDAEPFERLREAAEKYAERAGVRPTASLVLLGAEAKMTRLSTLVRALLEAGGYDVRIEKYSNGEEVQLNQAAAVFLEGAYTDVQEALTKLENANFSGKVCIIGNVAEQEETLRQRGATGFVSEANGVLPLLYELHNELEVIV